MNITAVTTLHSETAIVTQIDGYNIITEPSVSAGGTGEFPPATKMAVAALLNCSMAGMKSFCVKRDIALDGLKISFSGDFEDGMYNSMTMELDLPHNFPEKYKSSVNRVFEACIVKRIMRNLPEIRLIVKE